MKNIRMVLSFEFRRTTCIHILTEGMVMQINYSFWNSFQTFWGGIIYLPYDKAHARRSSRNIPSSVAKRFTIKSRKNSPDHILETDLL